MGTKDWKKVGKSYKNAKGEEVRVLKWSSKEYHILTNSNRGLKKIGVSRTKANADKKLKSYMRTH